MSPRIGDAIAILYIGFTALAGVVLIVISANLRRFFADRGAAEIGDSMQLLLVAMALVLWSSTTYFVWKGRSRTR